MEKPEQLRLLVVEDSELDAITLVGALETAGYQVRWRRVQTAQEMRRAFQEERWNLMLVDHQMPAFNAAEALELTKKLNYDGPFIIVSAGISTEEATALMRLGAHDFLKKGDLARLVPAVERELDQARIRAEQRESELRYRRLWENSPDAILMIDQEGRIRFGNPAVQNVFGYSPKEVEGLPVDRLAAIRIEELAQAAREASLSGGGQPLVLLKGRNKEGEELELEATLSAMEVGGESYYVAFVRDVTARRRAEQALAAKREEFALARKIQHRLYPKTPPTIPGLEIAGKSVPAEETGGDFFEYLQMEESCLGLTVGDVSGHGMGAALIMAETRAYLRIVAINHTNAGTVFTRINEALAPDLQASNQFVTAILARINPRKRTLAYANAGHPAGLVLDRRGEVKLTMGRRDMPLGLFPGVQYREEPSIELEPGDLVFLYSDGLVEACNDREEPFGQERALETLRACAHCPPQQVIDSILAALEKFRGKKPPQDDVTLVAARVLSFGKDLE